MRFRLSEKADKKSCSYELDVILKAPLRASVTRLVPFLCFIWAHENDRPSFKQEAWAAVYMPIKIRSVVGECYFMLHAQSQGCIQVRLQTSRSYWAAALEQRGLSHWPWHTATPSPQEPKQRNPPWLWYQSRCTSGSQFQLRTEVRKLIHIVWWCFYSSRDDGEKETGWIICGC